MLEKFLGNHVLANLAFALVLVLGALSYLQMPRERDPEINFNWINILTVLPGASAEEVEKRITDPIEDAIRRGVGDIDFVSSTSRDGISTLLVRFKRLDERSFDKRIIDLRREVQNVYTDQLPAEAEDPFIYEITTSNSFPTATLVLHGFGRDENFRRQARNIKEEVERLDGVDRVAPLGLAEPELQVRFYPDRLEGLGVTPADLADTVAGYFRDVSVGDLETREGNWVVRLRGTGSDPAVLAAFPVITASGVVPLGKLADIVQATEEASDLVLFRDKPAVILSVTKQAETNVLQLVERLNSYIDQRNRLATHTGVELFLLDDQTVSTREALSLMRNNALIGLALVLLVAWLFLGSRISLLTGIGIPFTLAGTFTVLNAMGMSLNNSVLLGVVIALGMIVDDAVVVVESIYYRIQRGQRGLRAAIDALREVFAPVTTSVMTTMAAFLPLMLLPGILGDFMRVIPLTVCIALAISLLEAYWMLPVHVGNLRRIRQSRLQARRNHFTHRIRVTYTRWLVRAMRNPLRAALIVLAIFAFAVAALFTGMIKYNFFAADAIRLFYVNVEMPRGATLEATLARLRQVQGESLALVHPEELRGSAIYAGQMFTQTEPLFADNVGQVIISLNPRHPGGRDVRDIADSVEAAVAGNHNGARVTLLRLEQGPPVSRPVNVKIRGAEFASILSAAEDLETFMQDRGHYTNISLDYRPGNPELLLKHNGEAIQRAGLSPAVVTRSLQGYVDGELVTQFQSGGEEINVRVKALIDPSADIDQLLRQTIALPDGGSAALGELLEASYGRGQQNIRHYNFRRTITLESDIREDQVDTVEANRVLRQHWDRIRERHPGVDLDFSGELDDVYEAMDSMKLLFVMGLGLIYLILGTQFRSYWQPFLIILGTLPLALTGVILGLLITRNPVSLYTLYGMVALAGISVNSAIVLISAANDRLAQGMSLLHATVYAARRRVIPILITSLTTIAGLFSLAAGLAGKSLVWGPVATAIVSGLAVSTVLTLFVIPLFYRISTDILLRRTGSTPGGQPDELAKSG